MNVKTKKSRAVAYKRQGIWVFRTGAPLKASVVRETIEIVWNEREQEVLGSKNPPEKKARSRDRGKI
jgi:hypothetical protein